jgi:hypothetical protein
MRRPVLYFTVAAVLVALAAAALYAVVTRSAAEPSTEDSALIAAGSTTVATAGELLGSGSGSAAGDLAKPVRHRRGAFDVKVGTVSGLYPGKIQRLPVVFSNPLAYPIRIRTATTSATGPAGCPADENLLLRTRAFPHLVVETNTTKRKSLRFGMLKTAPDACQSGAFTVTVTAKARRAAGAR